MRVVVRLVLLSGLAAAIALMVRDSLATRLARAIAIPALRLPMPRTADEAPAMLPMLPSSTPSTTPSILPILPTPMKHAPRAAAPWKRHVVTRKQVEEAIETRLSGANAVLVRDAEGKPAGLRLSGVAKLAPFGVQDGDVLVAANGMSLRTADEALAALGALKDAKHVTVTLRRGDKTYSVPIDLEESAPSAH